MEKNAKIYVAGHRGLAGSALTAHLTRQGYTNLVLRTHAQLDLIRQADVETFFAQEKPDYVFMAAAKVGGIHANNSYPADFIYDNVAIQANIIHSAWKTGVRRLLFLGSSCSYPRLAAQPMKESDLLTGALEPSNRPYAVAKIAGIEMCWSYNRQYGTRFLAVTPTNLYGPGDNYHPENSHVIPAMIRKFCEAKRDGAREVVLWGSGKPKREFMHSSDMASACLFLMNMPDAQFDDLLGKHALGDAPLHPPLINIGVGEDVAIAELARMVKDATGFEGAIRFDDSKPDGAPRKLLDSARMRALGWSPSVTLADGLAQAVQEFLALHRNSS